MITYVVCDLFESPARVLVNTVNTVGVMGKGIAKQFKQVYPDMFREYQEICESRKFEVGDLWLYKTANKWVLNFPTKKHWRQPSRIDYIESGLEKFVATYHVYGITSVSFPFLGCGNGELDWETQVQPVMERYLKELPIDVFIHLQDRPDTLVPEHRDAKATREWLRGELESLAFTEVWDDLINLSRSRDKFSKFENRGSFHVALSEADKKITVNEGDITESIAYESILDLWQLFRQSGFISGNQLSYGLDIKSDYLLPIMAELPYVHPVVMATQYDDISAETIGLRLLLRPRSDEAQLSLFANFGTVEPV